MPATASPRAPHAGNSDLLSWHQSFKDLTNEHGHKPLEVEGSLPPDLRGTFFKNGPALFGTLGRTYGHWFDGDGAMTAVRFDGKSATGAVRITQSMGLVEETKKGRSLWAGYGTTPKGFVHRLKGRVKNVANTSVMVWQDRLLALWEGGNPTELDINNLSTLGEVDLGFVAKAFSAHPHRVPKRQTTYNFGARFGRHNDLDLYALPDRGPGRQIGTVRLPAFSLVHDFIATDNHLIFFVPPIRLNVLPLLLGTKSFSDAMTWQPEMGTEIIVVPIDNPENVTRIQTDAFYQWHFANAWEQGETILVDYIRYPDFETNTWLGSLITGQPTKTRFGRMHRAEIDVKNSRFASSERWSGAPEFPRVSPTHEATPTRYVYVGNQSEAAQTAFAIQDGIAKIDMETSEAVVADAGVGCWMGEPVFVPREGATAEDDGYVLVMGYDAHQDRSYTGVYEARDMSPLAKAWFDHPIPLGFHGTWHPSSPQ